MAASASSGSTDLEALDLAWAVAKRMDVSIALAVRALALSMPFSESKALMLVYSFCQQISSLSGQHWFHHLHDSDELCGEAWGQDWYQGILHLGSFILMIQSPCALLSILVLKVEHLFDNNMFMVMILK